MPEVSVIIPSYNSARYLGAAVESVLAQTFTNFEVIVVDDGSKDDTQEVFRRYGPPVRGIWKQNGGVSSARNVGIAEATGRYVAFLDADDTWLPTKLAVQIAAMRDRPRYHASFSAFIRVDNALNPLGVSRCKQGDVTLPDLLLSGNIIGMSTVLCERSLITLVGGFDPALSQCADWDMWVRLAALTDFLYLDEPLATYRQHDSNMSLNPTLLERDSLRVLMTGFNMEGLPAGLKTHRRRALARNDVVLAGCYYHARRYRDMARCLARAAALDVRAWGYAAAFPFRATRRALATHVTRTS